MGRVTKGGLIAHLHKFQNTNILGVSSVIFGKGATRLQNGDDCNNCNEQGVWIKHGDNTSIVINNAPWPKTGFVLWYITPYQDDNSLTRYGVQVTFSYYGIKARRHNGDGAWTEWADILS